MPSTPYVIYNASAGSGKTSTLVKEYLKLVLGGPGPNKFQQILAITFTNKAVNEMKSRILDCLAAFSQDPANETTSHIFVELTSELGITASELRERSGKILKELLHNYAFFDVLTIDKFTHRLIRTFARDLRLPQNFEVILDTDLLLEEAVANLLSKAGEQKDLTKLLVEFALEKTEDDKSWDIGYDLFKIGKLLFNENHLGHVKHLRHKDLREFVALKTHLGSRINKLEQSMAEQARQLQHSMRTHQLKREDFKRGAFPDFLDQLTNKDFQKVNYEAQWKQNFREEVPYNKNCPEQIKATINSLLPQWRKTFGQIRQNYEQWSMLQNIYRNLLPLSILNAIQREVTTLQSERDQLPISDFNSLIADEIKNQPAPYIYERLGEKYRHYFIDEFQDTSEMQWRNLIPLIGSNLEARDSSGTQGTLLLVGDVKQAIYRWRGGRAEQFLNLIIGDEQPFTVAPVVKQKPFNYRSYQEIVSFNNEFFYYSSACLQSPLYRELYEGGSKQEVTRPQGGLVDLQFITPDARPKDELYGEHVLEIIAGLGNSNYAYSDICILTRTRAQGVEIANFLLQHGIPIISSETLLLKNHPGVAFLIDLLRYCLLPSDKNAIFNILYYLSDEEERHYFISAHLNEPADMLRKRFGFALEHVSYISVFDALEYAIRVFDLSPESNAYLTFLLDEALLVEQREDSSIQTFLAYWDKKQDKLSVVSPENINAVQIMTIHKAKGLEFPIVIYPYANTDIHNSRNEKDTVLWLPVEAEEFGGFDELLLNKKKEMAGYNELACNLYDMEMQKLELDAFNILYVTFTRAEKGLFILSELDLDSKGNPKNNKYSGIFINFLKNKGLWDISKVRYSFGQLPVSEERRTVDGPGQVIPHVYSHKERPEFRIVTQSGMLWDSDRLEAVSRGNILHELMGQVYRAKDIQPAIDRLIRKGDLSAETAGQYEAKMQKIIAHPELAGYFKEGLQVKNEEEILLADGNVLRPDKIILQGGKAVLLDYKTGQESAKYSEQLKAYSQALESMGFKVEKKIIVYINEEVVTEFI